MALFASRCAALHRLGHLHVGEVDADDADTGLVGVQRASGSGRGCWSVIAARDAPASTSSSVLWPTTSRIALSLTSRSVDSGSRTWNSTFNAIAYWYWMAQVMFDQVHVRGEHARLVVDGVDAGDIHLADASRWATAGASPCPTRSASWSGTCRSAGSRRARRHRSGRSRCPATPRPAARRSAAAACRRSPPPPPPWPPPPRRRAQRLSSCIKGPAAAGRATRLGRLRASRLIPGHAYLDLP